MPLIIFDPDSKYNSCNIPSKRMKGGALTGAIRCEYMELCNQITSRDITLDYLFIRNRILEIMKEDVIGYIHTLPDEDQPSLLADIELFYSSFDSNDTPFNCINIIGLQTSILFSNYIVDKSPFKGDSKILTEYKIYNDFKNKIVDNASKVSYRYIISDIDPTKGIPDTTPIFMIFIGGLSINELMKSYFNNVFFLWLSYKRESIDNHDEIINTQGYPLPSQIITHDIQHYDGFSSCKEYPVMFNELKAFYKYVSSIQDKSIKYAIMLTFFILVHENVCNSLYNIERSSGNSLNNELFNNITEKFIYNVLNDYLFSFKTILSIGMSIPKEYRELVEGSKTQLNEDKIKEYFRKVSKTYVLHYNMYQTTKNIQLGGKKRKTRRRKTRKRRIAH